MSFIITVLILALTSKMDIFTIFRISITEVDLLHGLKLNMVIEIKNQLFKSRSEQMPNLLFLAGRNVNLCRWMVVDFWKSAADEGWIRCIFCLSVLFLSSQKKRMYDEVEMGLTLILMHCYYHPHRRTNLIGQRSRPWINKYPAHQYS